MVCATQRAFGSRLPACAALLLVLTFSVRTTGKIQSADADLSVGALVSEATRYVVAYQQDFAFVVADEIVSQRALGPIPGAVSTRTSRGELFLTYLGAERKWMAVRDVIEVDGVPVRDGDNVAALLREGSIRAVASRVIAHNARYNLGNVLRNFNEPTIALAVLAPARVAQFRFARGAMARDATGVTLVTLAFRERDEPTLVKNARGRSVFSTGEVTVEAGSGRVRKTRFVVRDEVTLAELTTSFEPNDEVGLVVPTHFSEHYTARRNGRDEIITSESTYTNYRRFLAEGRIGPN